MKHFAIIENGTDLGASIVGVIDNIPKSKAGIDSFNERLRKAVADHFDIEDFNIDVVTIEDIFEYKPKEVSIEVDGFNYFVDIQETFFF